MRKVTTVYLEVLALAGMALLAGCQLGGRSAHYVAPANQVSEKTMLGYAQNIAFMRGHLRSAIANIEEDGALDDISAHASHPTVEGYYQAVGPTLKRRDPELASELKSVLFNMAKETEPTPFENALALLDDSLTTLVPPAKLDNPGFRIKALNHILEKSAHEYEEGITTDGQVRLAHEYQDAFGFFRESRALYQQIEAQIPAKKSREIGKQMDKLGTIFRSVILTGDAVAPKQVDQLVGDIVGQLTELIEET